MESKSSRRIVPLGVLAMAVTGLAVGCAATAHHESTGEVIDDSAITAKVKADLIADPQTEAHDIDVKTYRGVVQLSGFVDSAAERNDATRIARNEKGVRSVQDELQVSQDRTVGRAVDDTTISLKVKAALVANPDTQARHIDVTTSHGVVQLSGFVNTNEQRDAAANVAKSVSGVRSVDNGLKLKPPPQ